MTAKLTRCDTHKCTQYGECYRATAIRHYEGDHIVAGFKPDKNGECRHFVDPEDWKKHHE